MTCSVTIANTGQTFECPGGTVLDAAITQGVDLPYNCRGGACGTCKADVLEGAVEHGWGMAFAITDEEVAAGQCLICCSRPTSSALVLRMHNAVPHPAEGGAIAPGEYTMNVVSSYPVSESVRRLTVRCTDERLLRFDAGMYMEFLLEGIDPPRPYSIASATNPDGTACDGLFSFLVTRYSSGASSARLHDEIRVGDDLRLRGPYGTLRVPETRRGRVLMLAGGTGVAPYLSIACQLLSRGHSEEIELHFSVRDRSEMFLLDELHVLATRHENFHYQVFLTRVADQILPQFWNSGRITTHLRNSPQQLADTLVLIAGSPAFVADCAACAREAGAADDAILTESYELRPRRS